jgi:serine/threonine-protein kinase
MSAPSPTSWLRLRSLLEEALDLSDQARLHFVDALQDKDASLRPELIRMLAEHDRLGTQSIPNAIERATPALGDALQEEIALDNARIGHDIGPYRLARLLGTGGMGAVYLAERSTDGFSQQVALKVMRKAFGSPTAQERFERERRILAGLKHPGIALLFDGGRTSDGQSYYTMEYVDGEIATEYCYSRLDSVAARMRVLLQVASALAYAHQRLIVHRDIKPSNVLVTTDGRVKLVDFGLAKLLDSPADATMTQAGTMPMTPAYAAPEQFLAEEITVATDIYQFGVLCFVTLTGVLPYRGDPAEQLAWARAVTEDEPLTLARAFENSDLARLDVAAAKKYRHDLTRDLDAILRKALAKSPAERYGSTDAMMTDMRAFLDGAPVSARRAGPAYFAWRFTVRHRYAVAASIAAFMALGITAIAAVRQARIAQGEADRSRAAANFVGSLFEIDDDDVDSSQDPVKAESGEQALHTSIDLGSLAHARALLEKASVFLAKVDGKPSIGYANAEEKLGEINRLEGKFDDAYRHYDNSDRAFRAALGEHHYFRAWPLHARALAELDQHAYAKALEHFDEALSLLRANMPGDRLEVAMSLDGRAQALLGLGRYALAIGDAEEALTIVRRTVPHDHPLLVFSLFHVGLARYALGDAKAAEPFWTEALELGPRALASDPWRLKRIRDAIARPEKALADPVPVGSYY